MMHSFIVLFLDNDVDFETLKLLNKNQIIVLVPFIDKQARILGALKKISFSKGKKVLLVRMTEISCLKF